MDNEQRDDLELIAYMIRINGWLSQWAEELYDEHGFPLDDWGDPSDPDWDDIFGPWEPPGWKMIFSFRPLL